GDIYVASQLFGTSVKMIEKRYGHPNIERLHEQFAAFAARNPVAMPGAAGPAANPAGAGGVKTGGYCPKGRTMALKENHPRRQHYVPRFLLRNFLNDKGRFSVFDKA